MSNDVESLSVKDWGQRFRQLREQRGMSQEAVAAAAETTRITVGGFELRGEVAWKILRDMIRALGMTEAEFFESKIPAKYENPEHHEIHEQLQDVLEKGGNWEGAAKLGIESVHKNLMEQEAKASKAGGSPKKERHASGEN